MNILIFGGAGFIGCNAAYSFLKKGYTVSVFDNLSRIGTRSNLDWLKIHGSIDFVQGDIRSEEDVDKFIASHPKANAILHLAAQVAVTTSVSDPKSDFQINAWGTLNILEALRKHIHSYKKSPLLIFASTNKVYGELLDVDIAEREKKYMFSVLKKGIPETFPLDFHSPYGCSKGAADQYVIDYGRIYGLKTTSFRQSCIYGYRQFGVEDQGWVAWFTIASLFQKPITVFGDGKQARDILFIDDLIRCYAQAIENPDKVSGHIYNIGGGPSHTLSLLELLDYLEKMMGRKIEHHFSKWRPGDQKIFVSDIRKIKKDLRWEPKTSIETGLEKLFTWVKSNKDTIQYHLNTI